MTRLNIKTVFPGTDSYCKDKAAVGQSRLYNENTYTV